VKAVHAAVTLALLAFAGAEAGSGSPAQVERTEAFFVLRVKGPFEEVLTSLEEAIKRQNYFIAGHNNLDDTFRTRAAQLGTSFEYAHYKILSFCNLTLGEEALRAHPFVGAFMPCRMAIYVPKGSPEVVIVTMRPTFISRIFKSQEVERLASQVEADILEILKAVAEE
jgi:uncharacterized protein (DUF302 family)